MKDKFRRVLLEILGGPFTSMTGIVWRAYRDHLRDIDPETLPKNCQAKFKKLKDKIETSLQNKVDYAYEQAQSSTKRNPQWYPEISRDRVEEIFVNGARYPSGVGHHNFFDAPLRSVNLQEIKVLLFEIYDALPKRSKPKEVKVYSKPPIIDYPENREFLKQEFQKIADTPGFRESVALAKEVLHSNDEV